jgi:hypothetical protein
MTGAARAIAFLAVVTTPAAAQSWRTLDVSRQLRDSGEHSVRIRFPVGRLSLRATSDPVLYSMQLRYDEDHMRPIHRFDAESRRLTLGFDGEDMHVRKYQDAFDQSELTLALSNAVPLDLDLELGATEARLDVGGLAISRMRVETGAADARLDFSAPNKTRMRRLDITLGAAGFAVRNLGNANVGTVRVEGGVGSVDLDFGGAIEQDVSVDANVAIGKLTLRLPRNVGIRVELEKVVASFQHAGLTKRGGAYYSDNWDDARVRMRVRAETVFGAVEIDRTP